MAVTGNGYHRKLRIQDLSRCVDREVSIASRSHPATLDDHVHPGRRTANRRRDHDIALQVSPVQRHIAGQRQSAQGPAEDAGDVLRRHRLHRSRRCRPPFGNRR